MRICLSRARMLSLVAFALTAGCHAVPDPSCAVCCELSDQRCADVLFIPETCCDRLQDVAWYRCTPAWLPGCPPLFGGREAGRRIPPPEAVFALPEMDDPEFD